MFVGFDYGSANCAIGVMQQGEIRLLPLAGDSNYLVSTLYAFDRDLICEAVHKALPVDQQAQYAKLRAAQLSRARFARQELDLDVDEPAVFVGEAAVQHYLEMPEEGFYVRSPKSFLGATGLRADQVALFEDIVTMMMLHIKQRADALLADSGQLITHAVIGRPVNFQGIGGEESNRQAEQILSLAAARAGFEEVAFLFEPIAAGMDFEASLSRDLTTLVVDIGGGTSDCSVVKMGPSHIIKADRSEDFLGHSGQRIGGNDLDIALAMKAFMPHLGLDSKMDNGLPVPSKPFWNAVAVNDISAQRDFASLSCRTMIKELIKDAERADLLQHLLKVQQDHLGYRLVRSAEAAKIALSDVEQTQVALDYINVELNANVDESLFTHSVSEPVRQIKNLMASAIKQANVMPDIIYVTGGTAKSPAVYQSISAAYPDIEIVVGDHFASVAAGLTRWSQKLFA
ncbi:molecular chaperone [Shewanella sp. Isolate11]|uniref:molecular chaperone n=1 Tax=Shewanella sp. Isolate11 TaxID=2908530 RepID=UPI001EFEAEE6|nr:molecular chaperone [Shewanella sp. Isolate11]MCG9696481.1 molecular chaperone [Shewanella sp. Isolate11]